ncbi:MAG: hypothetical protein KGD63_04980 [Candidatus Lokiarchaeota archaeon]|nr:hypothetical protein [Candidatus Lokiarchaeota archaeon]
MNLKKKIKTKIQPVNLILLAISLIIFGGLGIIFMTQMESQSGWFWNDLEKEYPILITTIETDDLNGDGKKDIISYADIKDMDLQKENEVNHGITQFGGIYAFNAESGTKIWNNTYDKPVRNVYPIIDINNDGTSDFFVSLSTVDPAWDESNPDRKEIINYFDQFENFLIYGNNGSESIVGNNCTSNGIMDLVSFGVPYGPVDNLFCLELWDSNTTENSFKVNLTSYSLNGVQNYNEFTGMYFNYNNLYGDRSIFPEIFLYNHNGEDQLFFFYNNHFSLLDIDNLNFTTPIYNNSLLYDIESFTLIKDLNSDGNSEIAIIMKNDTNIATLNIFNGSNGSLLNSFNIPTHFEIDVLKIAELGNEISIDNTFIAIENAKNEETTNQELNEMSIYKLNLTDCIIEWDYQKISSEKKTIFHLINDDLDGDLINDVVIIESIYPFGSLNRITRIYIRNIMTNNNLAIINANIDIKILNTINDFDGDNKKDLLIKGWHSFVVLSSQDPLDIWLSPNYPLGIPFLIILVAALIIGIILLIQNIRKMRSRREEIIEKMKKRKLAIFVNVLSISLMTITFFLFLLQLNVFNSTLITGDDMTKLTIVFLLVSIIWYGMLPLTAAIFNQFAPRFAFFFVRLRNIFFKFSKKYDSEILVLDMEDRQEIGTFIKLKRVLLPLLLSITIGFYSYNTLTPILGYTSSFQQFGGPEFFDFIVGYFALCMLPMILSFVIFSFLIAGNYLLDDAGVVYFRQPKKYRGPGDIESISVWSQSMIKGMAGISAIFTFITFFSHVDFSGFFDLSNFFFLIFGTLMVVVIFWGTPFFTSFSYMLLSQEIMEFSIDDNIKKLYKKMEDHGFDTSPKNLTNLYPSGFQKKIKNE